LINRYLDDFDWAQNALDAEDYERFQSVVEISMNGQPDELNAR
jgi:hypothetical protein